MEQMLIVSNIVLWLVVIVLGIIVLALARQIGVLYERIAPAGALMVSQGPAVGDKVQIFELPTVRENMVRIGGVAEDKKSTLLFFLSPTCPVCNTLIPVLKSIQKREESWLDIILASDGDTEVQKKFIANKQLEQFDYVLSTELGMSYQVAKLPFAVLLDDQGILRAKGLTNNREHLESLFEAMERGVASIQDFMAQRRQGAA